MDPDLGRTFEALQPIEQGKLHAIADAVLPWALPALFGLRPYGINDGGKTKQGVPDSYVASSTGGPERRSALRSSRG